MSAGTKEKKKTVQSRTEFHRMNFLIQVSVLIPHTYYRWSRRLICSAVKTCLLRLRAWCFSKLKQHAFREKTWFPLYHWNLWLRRSNLRRRLAVRNPRANTSRPWNCHVTIWLESSRIKLSRLLRKLFFGCKSAQSLYASRRSSWLLAVGVTNWEECIWSKIMCTPGSLW